nr:type II and III secretion system protein family protein [Vibrio stylophorae]
MLSLPVSAATMGETLQVPHHKSINVVLSGKAKRVSLGDPEVLDIVMLRSNEVFLIGKKLGSTNVMAWDSQGRLIESINIEVTHDLNSLKAKLYQFLPNERIEVHSSQKRLILSGEVSSQAHMNTALKIAQTYTAAEAADEEQASDTISNNGVINLMSIGGSQQVMLEVTVAEVQRSLVRRFDSNFQFFNQNGNFGIGATSTGAGFLGSTPVFDASNITDTGLLTSFVDGNTLFTLALDVARQNGTAKVLAEPNLTALSGAKAEFLAGGEFPIPVPDDDGIAIEYKEYGVGLRFIPVVLANDRINLNLEIEVSEVANTSSLTITPGDANATYIIPPLTKRSASSTLELADGQTIGIAGLISENLRDIDNRMPGLGDVPVLGQLFASQEYIKGETELVILVTPRLAQPVDRNKVTLPTDGFVEPSDIEYYLLGKRPYPVSVDVAPEETTSQPTTVTPYQGGSEGEFGHSL